jgi:hypothetical protein
LRKASTLLSARLALRVRERALGLRDEDRRELEERELERRALEARDALDREPDLRDVLRELPRREPEPPEPCAISFLLLGGWACRSRLSHRFERE